MRRVFYFVGDLTTEEKEVKQSFTEAVQTIFISVKLCEIKLF